MGKLSQAVAHGARLLQVDGNFDDCLVAARKLAEAYPVELVNSVNPDRIEGQKTGAFEIVDALGDAPDIHVLPVGNAGNITAYWKGFREYAGLDAGAAHAAVATRTPIMWGFQAAGAAPIVAGPPDRPSPRPSRPRSGSATRPRGSRPRTARDVSGGLIEAVTDEQILAAHRVLSAEVGVFVEPASAAGRRRAPDARRRRAGCRRARGSSSRSPGTGSRTRSGRCARPDGSEVVPVRVTSDVVSIADALGLD